MTHGQFCPTAEKPSSVATCWHAGLANGCVSLPLVFALHGALPGIHKVFQPLCISMSKTFTVFERMPCSHITAPLAMIPANSWNFVSPEELHLWGLYLLLTHTPGGTTGHWSFPLRMVLHCVSHCEWKDKDRAACSYCFFWFWSAFKVHVSLHKIPDCSESWRSSSGLCVTGRVVMLWNAHPGVSLFQTVCLMYDCIPFFMCKKERTGA